MKYFILSLLFISCAALEKSKVDKNEYLSISVEEVVSGEFLPYIKIIMDGVERKLLLDTGAYKSSVETDEWSKTYSPIESDQTHFSHGASGIKVKCDLIEIKKIEIGDVHLANHYIERCKRNIFGLDLIGDSPFEVDYKNKKLKYLSVLDKAASQKLRRMRSGHLTVKTKLNGREYNTIIDTGATATVVDLSFVQKYPKLFKLVKRDDGIDGHSGESIESYRYQLLELMVGDKTLRDISIIAFDFPDNMKKGLKGSPIMIGNNIIGLAIWQFDLRNMLWNMKEY